MDDPNKKDEMESSRPSGLNLRVWIAAVLGVIVGGGGVYDAMATGEYSGLWMYVVMLAGGLGVLAWALGGK